MLREAALVARIGASFDTQPSAAAQDD